MDGRGREDGHRAPDGGGLVSDRRPRFSVGDRVVLDSGRGKAEDGTVGFVAEVRPLDDPLGMRMREWRHHERRCGAEARALQRVRARGYHARPAGRAIGGHVSEKVRDVVFPVFVVKRLSGRYEGKYQAQRDDGWRGGFRDSEAEARRDASERAEEDERIAQERERQAARREQLHAAAALIGVTPFVKTIIRGLAFGVAEAQLSGDEADRAETWLLDALRRLAGATEGT